MIVKKQSLLFMAVLSLALCLSATLPSNDDDFLGTWRVKIVGTPLGDFTSQYAFEKKDGKLTGIVQDTTGKEFSKMTDVAVTDNTITGAYVYETHDVKFNLVAVDKDHIKGKILDAYEVTGVRLKTK